MILEQSSVSYPGSFNYVKIQDRLLTEPIPTLSKAILLFQWLDQDNFCLMVFSEHRAWRIR